MRHWLLFVTLAVLLGGVAPLVRAEETRYFYGTVTAIQQAEGLLSFTYVDEGTGEGRQATVRVTPETEWGSNGRWEDVHIGQAVYIEAPAEEPAPAAPEAELPPTAQEPPAPLTVSYLEIMTPTPAEEGEP